MSEIEWVDDLPSSDRLDTRSFVDELRRRPGRWAKYKVTSSPAGNYRKLHPGTEWRAVTVDGERALYARFVGDN